MEVQFCVTWANGHTPLRLGRGTAEAPTAEGLRELHRSGLAQRLAHSGRSLKESRPDRMVPPRTKDRWAASREGRAGAGQVLREWGGGASARAGGRARARAAGACGVGGAPRGRGLQVAGAPPEDGDWGRRVARPTAGKSPVSLTPSPRPLVPLCVSPPSRSAASEPSSLH